MLVTQLCLTLWDPMDCNLPGSFVHGILQARILEYAINSLLQGIFLTPGLNLGLLHCMQAGSQSTWATRNTQVSNISTALLSTWVWFNSFLLHPSWEPRTKASFTVSIWRPLLRSQRLLARTTKLQFFCSLPLFWQLFSAPAPGVQSCRIFT